jgi:hypothetical protein
MNSTMPKTAHRPDAFHPISDPVRRRPGAGLQLPHGRREFFGKAEAFQHLRASDHLAAQLPVARLGRAWLRVCDPGMAIY